MFSCFQDTFNKESLKNSADIKWHDLLIQCKDIKPSKIRPKKIPESNENCKWLYDFQYSKYFDIILIIVIGLNAICLSLDFQDSPSIYNYVLDQLDYVFLSLFCLEALIKTFTLGIKYYFSVMSNIFDFIIILFGVIEMITNRVSGDDRLNVIKTLQIIRILKIFRIIR